VLYVCFKDVIKEPPPKILQSPTPHTPGLRTSKRNIKKEPGVKKEKTLAVKKELFLRKRALS
jgi:hypothetical protein